MADEIEAIVIGEPLAEEEYKQFEELGRVRVANDTTLQTAMAHHTAMVMQFDAKTQELFEAVLGMRGIDMQAEHRGNYQFAVQHQDDKQIIVKFKKPERTNGKG